MSNTQHFSGRRTQAPQVRPHLSWGAAERDAPAIHVAAATGHAFRSIVGIARPRAQQCTALAIRSGSSLARIKPNIPQTAPEPSKNTHLTLSAYSSSSSRCVTHSAVTGCCRRCCCCCCRPPAAGAASAWLLPSTMLRTHCSTFSWSSKSRKVVSSSSSSTCVQGRENTGSARAQCDVRLAAGWRLSVGGHCMAG